MLVYVMDTGDVPSNGYWMSVATFLNAVGITVTGTPLSELSAENAELQRRLEVHRVANTNYSKVIDDLRSDVQKLTDSNAEADRTIADLEGNLERLGDTFRTVCDDRDAIAKENDTLRNNIGVLTVEIDRLKAQNAHLLAARQERDEWLAERDRKIAQLLATLESIRYHATNAV